MLPVLYGVYWVILFHSHLVITNYLAKFGTCSFTKNDGKGDFKEIQFRNRECAKYKTPIDCIMNPYHTYKKRYPFGCQWVTTKAYKAAFKKRDDVYKQIKESDLDLFEKWTLPTDLGGDVEWELETFDEKKWNDEYKKELGHTQSKPAKIQALKPESDVKKRNEQTLQTNQQTKLGDYDLRVSVKTEKKPIEKADGSWYDIGKLFGMGNKDHNGNFHANGCTATIIGKQWLLTAAHCVAEYVVLFPMQEMYPAGYDTNDHKFKQMSAHFAPALLPWPDNVFRFVRGYNGAGSEAKATTSGHYVTITTVYVPVGWMIGEMNKNRHEYDYAILMVNNVEYDSRFSIGFDDVNVDFWRKNTFQTAGYPSDKENGHVLFYSPIQFVNDKTNVPNLDEKKKIVNDDITSNYLEDLGTKAAKGQSGSPVSVHVFDTNVIMGVLSAHCAVCNEKVNKEMEALNKLINIDPGDETRKNYYKKHLGDDPNGKIKFGTRVVRINKRRFGGILAIIKVDYTKAHEEYLDFDREEVGLYPYNYDEYASNKWILYSISCFIMFICILVCVVYIFGCCGVVIGWMFTDLMSKKDENTTDHDLV